MNKKIISWILKAPLLLLVLVSFIGGFYASYSNIGGVTYSTPTLIGIIIILYILGERMFIKELKGGAQK